MSPAIIKNSIIVCTKDRHRSLEATLASIIGTGALCGRTELIVVDNGPTDESHAVFEKLLGRHPAAHYVVEPRRGVSFGRNRGIAAASGDVLLFTDDDVRLPPGWVDALSGPIRENRADAVQGGVRIATGLDRKWMKPRHRAYLASTEMMDAVSPAGLISASVAVGRGVFDRVPQFDVELGPGALGFCEETLFGWQMLTAGFRIAGALDCSVEHHFDPSRLAPSAWIARARGEGRSMAYVDYHWRHEEERLDPIRRIEHAIYNMLMGLRRSINDHVPGVWELRSLYRAEYAKQMLAYRNKPRNYEKRGLVKIRGLGSAPNPPLK